MLYYEGAHRVNDKPQFRKNSMAHAPAEERIRINTLEDISRRPHYVETVPPRKSLFRYVLAAYSFPRKIASCAVSDCFLNHKKGYLVRTADGGECSVCQSCAQRFLDPAALLPPKPVRTTSTGGASRSPRAPKAEAATRRVSAPWLLEQSERIKARVKALKQMHRGGNWLYQSQSEFQKAYPPELIEALQQLHGDPDAVLEALIESDASDQQLDDIEQLEGLAIFAEDIRERLIERILKPLSLLCEKAEKAGAQGTLELPLSWEEQVEADLNVAEGLIAEGQRFFTDANLARLRSLPLSDKAAQAVKTRRWDCDQGRVRGS